jgi:two-component system OmpR family sensor kinase
MPAAREPQRRAAPASRLGRWLAGRTLRGRLVAGLLATLTVACAAVGALTYTHLHSVLISQLDTELTQASTRYIGCIQPPPQGAGGTPGATAPGGGTAPTGTTPKGTVPRGKPVPCAAQQQVGTFTGIGLASDTSPARAGVVSAPIMADIGACRLTAADYRHLADLPVGGGPRTITLADYGSYQLMAVRSGDGVFVTGLPLTPVTQTLQQVAIAEIVVFAVALLATGLIGTAWVRVSLRPLRRVAATATRVTELPLGSGEVALAERVPDANPATEVGQVGAAFNKMLGHVESALARRAASESRLRRFAADASHELRTPLAAIRGYAELARRHPGPVPDEVAHALSRVESESARMSVLVDELLLLAQLDAGRPLASEPVDLTRLAIDVTSDAQAAAADHRWRLELPGEPVSVRGDEHRLHQVLANLLSNAARHTPPGTTVTVALAAAEPGPSAQPGPAAGPDRAGPEQVQVSVTDDGPGIPAELQPAMFERFVRGDSSRSRAAGSTGLGLAIVDAVTTAHHGRVEVTSAPGHTRFTITLPALDESPG